MSLEVYLDNKILKKQLWKLYTDFSRFLLLRKISITDNCHIPYEE